MAAHQRLKVLQEMGITQVDVSVVDLDEAKEKALNIALNKISGEWDLPKLKDLLEELDASGMFDIEITGFDLDEIDDLMTQFRVDSEIIEDEAPDLPEEPITKTGDLWVLGRHRLLCGDSTKATDVERLLDGAVPLLMVTDPPYGVNYDPTWRVDAGVSNGTNKMGRVQNDDKADWREAWALFPGDILYVWHAGRHAATVQQSLEACDFEIRSQIIWAKDRLALSRGHYHWQHEPCWYAVKKGRNGNWQGDRKQATLWNIPSREDSGHGHGTQKPVECMARPIRNNSNEGQAVYEPFNGSGTTIIACEQLGRACYAIEIDPRYVDVAVQRWET